MGHRLTQMFLSIISVHLRSSAVSILTTKCTKKVKCGSMKHIDRQLLDETVGRIVAALQPERIYLYGSHAYGQPHADSDVDLLIVVHDSVLPPHKRAVEAYRTLRGLFLPAEIKVVTQEEFERRAQWLSSVERTVQEKGQILYDAAVR